MRNPRLQATAILLAEPAFFDDEKEKAVKKELEKGTGKRLATTQLSSKMQRGLTIWQVVLRLLREML